MSDSYNKPHKTNYKPVFLSPEAHAQLNELAYLMTIADPDRGRVTLKDACETAIEAMIKTLKSDGGKG